MASQFLNFNVAGHRFTTSKDTILKEPASRLALIVRGVLPAAKDEAGCTFLDRDPRQFQLVLNYLRDGWCQLPKASEERRELLQEVRYYQLAGMETWLLTQDVLGDAALHQQSPDPYSSQHAPLALNLMPLMSSPGTPQHASHPAAIGTGRYQSAATGGYRESEAAYVGPGSLSLHNSFLHGANQDLLAAGAAAAAGIRLSSISPAQGYASPVSPATYGSRSSAVNSPESSSAFKPYGAGMKTSLAFSPLSGSARPSSASPYIGAMASSSSSSPAGDVAAGYAAGFAAAQQNMLAARQSMSAGDSMASQEPSTTASTFPPAPQNQDGFKWTGRYLASNARMQEVANTLLELMSVPPHASLHAGKTSISISSECDHDRISGLVGLAASSNDKRFETQVVRVKSTMGWSYEFSLRPSSDLALFDKYNVAEYLQDNWFVLTACLKDMYGVIMEEDSSAKPKCMACRRSNIGVILQKVY